MTSNLNSNLTLAELHRLIKVELDDANENAQLSREAACFEDQQEYWSAKVDAYQMVLSGLEKTQEFLDTLKSKTESVSRLFKLFKDEENAETHEKV